ncbi:MAG: hypothetical protein WCJ26_08405 [bacterium]
MKLLKICILFVLLSAITGTYGQEVIVSAKLDTNAMLIGDHVGLSLKFTGPAKSQVLWPFMPDTILGSITVIGRGKIDTSFSADKKSVTLSQQINVTCYDSGFYTIPSIPFRHRILPDTTALVSHTTMMLLAVHTVKVDTTQAIKPIMGPLKVPLSFREMLPWILAGIACILAIGAVIWYLRKRKKKEPVFSLKPKVVLLPHEMALREFEKLRVKKLWQAGKVKEYHSELTEILRKYIEDRFRVPALEQTTAEITSDLMSHAECPRNSLDKLTGLLTMADMVKFARTQPLPAENENSLGVGIEFVYETTEVKNV